ncbi:MAG: helix-turn-helix transcriptional regulator [Bacilli bacterium]|nr:helix-turn-helix transcriptional regulator [Bacilli bacterium]
MKRAGLIASLDIGASIKKLRESRGLSQDELAKDICDRTTITKLENGFSKIPSFIFILQICDKLGVTLDEFINMSLSNSYSLDKKMIFDSLFNNDIIKISEYLSNIDIETLSIKDQQLYNYLIAKIYINDNKMDKAKAYLLRSLNQPKNFKTDNITELLAYHELLKYELIVPRTKSLDKILIENILELSNKDISYLYLIDMTIKNNISNKDILYPLLERELAIINDGNHKYLPLYYKNKLEIYKDDPNIKREIESKLKAVTKINKIGQQY